MKGLIKGAGAFLTKKAGIWLLGLIGFTSASVLAIFIIFIVIMVLLIGAFATTSNDSGGGFGGGEYEVHGLSPHVLAYEPLVHKYATLEGIPEYTPVILSLLQRESGGSPNALDPMQSSESLCGYIGCITNPDHSFKHGIKHFKSVLELAEYDLKLTLSSYNFGTGFVMKMKRENKKFEFDKVIGGLETSSHALAFSQVQYKKVLASGGKYTCSRQGVNLASYQACYGDIFYVQDIMSRLNVLEDGGFEIVDGNTSNVRKNIASVGNKWIGKTRYYWGGGRSPATASKGQFDCSSFVHWAYKENGIELGNMGSVSTETLNKVGKKIPMSEIQVGDLIFWDSYKKDGHVGIYIGNGKFIGSQSSTGVAIEPLSHSYWSPIFSGHVRRVIND